MGIDDIATRADLMDRAVSIKLPVIPEEARREEAVLNTHFEEARPRILGAFLTVVSAALRNYPSTNLPLKPRMADFARFATSAESALGWEPGSFLDVYSVNREESNVAVIENSVIGPLLLQLVEREGTWNGTSGDLLRELTELGDDKTPAIDYDALCPFSERRIG